MPKKHPKAHREEKRFIENKPKEDSTQALAFEMDGDKCMQVRENMSLPRFSISKSMRLDEN